jgi:predicted dehydrogenase
MQKDPRLLRIGVLGAGPISQAGHFEAVRKAHNAELYAICDAAEDLLASMAATHGPHITYRDYDQMLADPQVEAVILATADQFHVPLARKAIAAGKHVLVEKPLGVNLEECEALREQLAANQLIFQIGNNRRFDPGIAFARQFTQERLGQRLAFKAWYYDSVFRYTMTDNLQPIMQTSAQARRPGGNPKADKQRYFMLTHGSHLVDTTRFLGGEIVAVQARLVERFESYCWFVAVDFADGSVGHIDLIIPVRGDFEEGFQIYGEHGSVVGKLPLTWYHKSSSVECFSSIDRQYHRPLGEDAFTYKLQVEGFANTILSGAPQRGANIDDGIAAMRAMVAIARSVETGTVVALADVSGSV